MYNKTLRERCLSIADKMKEAFREKVLKIIDEMKKEFDLKLYTTLTIKSNTRELCKAHAEVHGIDISGKIMINSILQDFSDDVVEKVIKSSVYMLAQDYEDKCSKVTSVKVGSADLSAGEIKSSTMATLPAEIKFRLNVSRQEYLKIDEDYAAAIKQINEELKKY